MKEVPKCTKATYHRWFDGHKKFGESQICYHCGYDKLEHRYRSEV